MQSLKQSPNLIPNSHTYVAQNALLESVECKHQISGSDCWPKTYWILSDLTLKFEFLSRCLFDYALKFFRVSKKVSSLRRGRKNTHKQQKVVQKLVQINLVNWEKSRSNGPLIRKIMIVHHELSIAKDCSQFSHIGSRCTKPRNFPTRDSLEHWNLC